MTARSPSGYKHVNTMKIIRNIIIGLMLLVGGIMILMLLPSPQGTADKPWEVTIMDDGNPRVLGIHLGNTDYKSAQQHLGVFGETALFVDPDGSRSVEAFFDSINQAGLSAKLVLNLDVSEDRMQAMQQHATAGERQPSGARQLELSEQDREFLLTAPVKALTYMPSVRLKPEMIKSRFGEADKVEQKKAPETGLVTETWHYPAIGLTIVFRGEDKPILVYQARTL